MSRARLRNRKGFTLIEVTVSLAILGLVSLGVFSLFSYGNAAFSLGKMQNMTQSEVRLVTDYVLQSIRFATFVELEGTAPVSVADDYKYDYLYFQGGKLIHSAYNDDDPRVIRQWGAGIEGGSHFWSHREGTSQVFGVNLFAQEANRHFDVKSSIVLPNIGIDGKTFAANSSSAVAVKFSNDYVVEVSDSTGGGGGSAGLVFVNLTAETINPLGFGGGQVYGSGYYGLGSHITISAMPFNGYEFRHWKDNDENVILNLVGPMYPLTVTKDYDLSAVFEWVGFTSDPYVNLKVVLQGTANASYTIQLTDIDPDSETKKGNTHEFSFDQLYAGVGGTGQEYSITIWKNGDTTPILDSYDYTVLWVEGGATLSMKEDKGKIVIVE